LTERGIVEVAIYMHGNLALKEEERREGTQKRKQAPSKRPAIPASEKLLYLGVIVLCMLVAGAVLYQTAQLYSVNTRIQDVQREIQRLEKENQKLKLEGEKLREPQRLYELGKQLGFAVPAEENVIPVSPDKHIITSTERKTAYVE
jgi:cell division protein FtsL